MSPTPKQESRIRSLLWANASHLPGIKTALDSARWAAFFVAAFTAVFALLGPTLALLDAFIFALLGIGIGRKSRLCALAALIIYAIEKLYGLAIGQGSWNIILRVIFVCS